MLSAEPNIIAAHRRAPAIELIAALFFIMSVGTLVFLAFLITATGVFAIPDVTIGMRFWALVQAVGIIRPLLILFAGFLCLRLSLLLRQGDIGAARWALLVYNWLALVGIAFLVFRVITANPEFAPNLQTLFQSLLPAIAGLVVIILLRQFIAANVMLFYGDEDIYSKRTRNAWNLLTPTLIVFVVIALTPLEQVFIKSLTDERFASADPISFIGLENYNRIWSVRMDILPCETDADGNCLTEIDANGNEQILFPRARNYFRDLDESTGVESNYVALRYRDMTEFNLFGEHVVISARDTEFVQSVITSVQYTFLAIFFQFVIGFFMAMIIAQRVRGIGILRVVMLVPMAIPTLIASQFWDVMLRPDETGLINAMLMNFGMIAQPQQWLLNPALQIPTLVAVIVWKETPVTALLLLPGLLAIPNEVYQAGAIDGANRLQRFWSITLPMMRPTIGVALVLRTMVFLRVFDLFEILVGRTRFVMATYAHDALIQRQQLGYSSAISVTIFIVTMFFTIAYMRTLKIDEA